jgi:hypothetical protein
LAQRYGGRPHQYVENDEALSTYARYCIDEAAAIAGSAADERAARQLDQDREQETQEPTGQMVPLAPVQSASTGGAGGTERLWSSATEQKVETPDRQGAILSMTDDGQAIIKGWMPYIGKKDS